MKNLEAEIKYKKRKQQMQIIQKLGLVLIYFN
jgi:hypothetical protein